ncbi:MAG TPA: NlpC/P60 family protein [Afifellaceae bacterium]|nr:NlpC/P60 family protein [Afifellaceae bacterium]
MTSLDPRLHAYRTDLADARLEGRVNAARFVEHQERVVAATVASLRRRPAPDASLDTEALRGEAVHLFEETAEGWAWVQLARDGYVGWMPSEALVEPGAPATHRVSVPRTLVFPGPDIKLPPLGWLPMGATVFVSGEAEDKNARYGLIEPAGAVALQHLAPVGETEPDSVAVAERLLHTPYLWGGRTSLGIDCSGLVQLALEMAGRPAPRDCDMQVAAIGSAIDITAGLPPLARGDLVFWSGHVGIMQNGERLLHANAHHMAVASEDLAVMLERMEVRGQPITALRRP